MRWPTVLLHLPLALVVLGGASSAWSQPLCRSVLPDGRVLLSRPVVDGGSFVCRPVSRALTAPSPILLPVPSTKFTTGTIGPFTTGQIGPFTSGEIGPFTTGETGPFTTFSNSPAGGTHR